MVWVDDPFSAQGGYWSDAPAAAAPVDPLQSIKNSARWGSVTGGLGSTGPNTSDNNFNAIISDLAARSGMSPDAILSALTANAGAVNLNSGWGGSYVGNDQISNAIAQAIGLPSGFYSPQDIAAQQAAINAYANNPINGDPKMTLTPLMGTLAVLTGGLAAGAGGLGAEALGAGAGAGSAAEEAAMLTGSGLGVGGGAGGLSAGSALGGLGMDEYSQFLQSIGIDPASTQFSGGTLSNADIMSQIMGGSGGLGLPNLPNLPPGTSQILQSILGAAGGGGTQGGIAGGGANPAGGLNLGSLLPLLGVGSGLNTMLNQKSAVDPNLINAIGQAGQQTYLTALDPQQALYNRTLQQVQDQSRAADSARGLAMSPYSAGLENQATRDFNIDWQNQQLQRQIQALQGFSGAGNVAANAGIANNAQAFMQNQVGLNNLTTGLNGLFGTGAGTGTGSQAGGTGAGAQSQNPIGAWLNQAFNGFLGGQNTSPSYNTFDPSSSYNAQGVFQPYYTGLDIAGGPAYG